MTTIASAKPCASSEKAAASAASEARRTQTSRVTKRFVASTSGAPRGAHAHLRSSHPVGSSPRQPALDQAFEAFWVDAEIVARQQLVEQGCRRPGPHAAL